MTLYQKHAARIEREYVLARQVHVWRVECTCGFKGEDRLSPRQAERDLDQHIGVE